MAVCYVIASMIFFDHTHLNRTHCFVSPRLAALQEERDMLVLINKSA